MYVRWSWKEGSVWTEELITLFVTWLDLPFIVINVSQYYSHIFDIFTECSVKDCLLIVCIGLTLEGAVMRWKYMDKASCALILHFSEHINCRKSLQCLGESLERVLPCLTVCLLVLSSWSSLSADWYLCHSWSLKGVIHLNVFSASAFTPIDLLVR